MDAQKHAEIVAHLVDIVVEGGHKGITARTLFSRSKFTEQHTETVVNSDGFKLLVRLDGDHKFRLRPPAPNVDFGSMGGGTFTQGEA